MSLATRDSEVFLQGLKRMKAQGVGIYVDGLASDEGDWHKILTVSDNNYYMGDYISDTDTGRLVEIRFDKISL